MSDVTCPYCHHDQEINHDDGYGYEEDRDFEQDCIHCEKTFVFQTSISFSYEVMCQPEDHKLEPAGDKWPGLFACLNCDFYEVRREKQAAPLAPPTE